MEEFPAKTSVQSSKSSKCPPFGLFHLFEKGEAMNNKSRRGVILWTIIAIVYTLSAAACVWFIVLGSNMVADGLVGAGIVVCAGGLSFAMLLVLF